ncbi:30S ribosomal protein S14 [Candidatus Micrarchaeota archaeon CG_4_10_14_0_2_um_filter_60_11]|nr:MAG: 30S ribosomal protein S14 [Candidatus Micrarchaeota archaeon CG1_02_60_51]PIN96505.1 MAG: 30S ribosomal protein S14 [Candidatus Micrarchaeota archaeon CG10_big_fil_rev_8_21_14_0_10_60_32]PIO01877.1 MAG: 30S ribosomal protein S14 [Candidatus Micrarchaeota archaeon CG09_land_8_20_14_0_10_60_16]PIY91556.1 MAG: 30S ribosomal protein S14 [Candidatus Micrarchaeota archaeon CG_4_10_14_0_8_um_filter_60_7]PIZ90842.1 MAG: 30S ribosomal protein S14 [Candidatus Micrarchaeota archaeon CG_4_10_14_0_2
MSLKLESRYKKRMTRMCKLCGASRGLIRKYGLNICRKCFRERAKEIGFKKYS